MPAMHDLTPSQNPYASTERVPLSCAKLGFLMAWIRPRLARVAAGWLVFKVALLVWIPTTMHASMTAAALAAECTCDHGDGQMCPMHHVRTKAHGTAESQGAKPCSCRGTSDPLAALTASIIGSPAVLGAAAASPSPLEPAASVGPSASEPLYRASVPDSPPPRS
jgi:hypothetical protein